MSTSDGRTIDQSTVRAYYEQEAVERARPALRPNRIGLRNDFIDLLAAEGRRSVVDFGAGPGRDVAGFREAGLRAVGIDLAVANATLAAASHKGSPVIPGSILAPPIRCGSFDAGWSISTLMHLDRVQADRALEAMTATLKPGAPFLIGVWGGDDEYRVDDDTIADRSRPFHLRSPETNRSLIGRWGDIEAESISDESVSGQYYQVYRLRLPS